MFTLLAGLLWITTPIKFQEALDLVDASPVVQAAERVADQRRAEGDDVSRLTANPLLQVQPGGRRMSAGGTGAELYLGLSQRLNLGGFGKKRKASVAREVEQDAALSNVTRQQVRLSVAAAWLARWSAQAAIDIAAHEQRLAEELEQRLERTLAAGEATRVDLAMATAWRAESALRTLSAEGEAFESGIELARALGVAPESPQQVAADLPSIDLPEQQTMLATLHDVAAAPQLVAAEAQRATEQARLEEVSAARAPQLAVGALGWREGAGDFAAVATFELEIPLFDRGQRERATQAAAIARAEGDALEAALLARSARALSLHEVEHSRQVLETVEQKVLVAAEALAEAQRIRLEAREATTQEWVLARRAVLTAKLEAIRARADHMYARFVAKELWRAHGASAGRARSTSTTGRTP